MSSYFARASTYGLGLRPSEFLDAARRGDILTYDVDVTKCDVKLPPTLPAYSFGDVMTDVYIESGSESETQWRLYTASERPVNTSRFQIESKAQIMKLCLRGINQSIFYFMSVHIEVILDPKNKHIIIIYTNFSTGL